MLREISSAVEHLVYTEIVTSSILVSPMKFFDNKDFEYNESWAITKTPWKDSEILFIDNIYKRPERVYDYLNSIQGIRTNKSVKNSLNGTDFMDGQILFDSRWDLHREYLLKGIANNYNVEVDLQNLFHVVNQFRLLKDIPGKGYHWHPHCDGQLNFIIFLNPDHHMKSGTSLYTPLNTKAKTFYLKKDTEHNNPWKTSDQFREELCILDKFNCGVVFPGKWFHGQTIVDNFFKTTTRFTEVIFL